MDSKVFRGVGVMITQVLSDTSLGCKAVIDQSVGAYNARPTFPVDFTRTVSQGFATAIYDDRGVDGNGHILPATPLIAGLKIGVTSIGSSTQKGANDMRIGAFCGGLYILNDGPNGYSYLRDNGFLGTAAAPWPDTGMALYQYTSVAYADGRRYHGFHGRFVSRKGNSLTLALSGVAGLAATNLTFDVTDKTWCDPSPPSIATSGASSLLAATKPTDEGAIFIALARAAVEAGVPAVKLPSGEGG